MRLFSIIIVNFKTKKLTADCLDSVLANCRGDFEIIVVDNNSADGSADYLGRRFGSRVKIIPLSDNLGFGRANNEGEKKSQGSFLFFLNSDTIITSDVLAEFTACFNDPDVAVVAPRLILPDGRPQPDSLSKFPDLLNTLMGKFNISPNEQGAEWVSGAALAVKKSVFDEIGGFDEKFFMYFEDVDLCYRVKKTGKKIKIAAGAAVTHLGGKSIADNAVRKKYYYQSQDYFFRKHFGVIPEVLLKLFRIPYLFFNKYF
jgi:GT2 family glycosyltransferase